MLALSVTHGPAAETFGKSDRGAAATVCYKLFPATIAVTVLLLIEDVVNGYFGVHPTGHRVGDLAAEPSFITDRLAVLTSAGSPSAEAEARKEID